VEDLPVHKVELNVHAPMFQEGFHASWTRPASGPDDTWRLDLPLVVDGNRVGQIVFAGERSPELPRNDVERILALCECFENQLGTILTTVSAPKNGAARPPHVALEESSVESTVPQGV
jgi:hypothetical protein